jgi:HSP20 family molecular chaperone IbpA
MRADLVDHGVVRVRVSSPHFCIMPAAALEMTSPHLCIMPAAALDLYREPLMNIANTADHFVLTVEMPGVKKEGLTLTLKGRLLEIEGKKKPVKATDDLTHAEAVAGTFYRSLELPEEVTAEGVRSELVDGVLEIVLPKSTATKVVRLG